MLWPSPSGWGAARGPVGGMLLELRRVGLVPGARTVLTAAGRELALTRGPPSIFMRAAAGALAAARAAAAG
eukprot:2367316-Lingulodinium_polyedra.AAC.1